MSAPPSASIVLASASPARRKTLEGAGIAPEVIVSGVDESGIDAGSVTELVSALAALKADAVHATLGQVSDPRVVIGCDSLLEFEGRGFGKPGSVEAVVQRWSLMRGRSGVLRTGHRLIFDGLPDQPDDSPRVVDFVGSATVHFADLADDEIAAYAATGEPEQVAGGFTLDGYGGPLIDRIEGDPHTVIGISLPMLRRELRAAGLAWPGFSASN